VDLLAGEPPGGSRILRQYLIKWLPLGEGLHARDADHLVCLLPVHPFPGKCDHHGLGHIHPVEEVEVLPDVLLPDDQPFQHPGKKTDAVVGKDGRLGKDHPLAGGVREVALVPEGVVLEGRLDCRPDHPRQPADLLAPDGIPLVGHRARPDLLLPERLLNLGDLAPLQGPERYPDLVKGRCHIGKEHEVFGVPVACDHLV